jgi:hypothetical protein
MENLKIDHDQRRESLRTSTALYATAQDQRLERKRCQGFGDRS